MKDNSLSPFTGLPPSAQQCDRFHLELQRKTGNTYAGDAQSPVRDRKMDV